VERGEGRCVDDAGGFDAERGLELLQRDGQLVGPDAVDRAAPEASERERGLRRRRVGQVGGLRLPVERGQQLVERGGRRPAREPGLGEVAVGLRLDGGRTVDRSMGPS
jgi:hypothetical protein